MKKKRGIDDFGWGMDLMDRKIREAGEENRAIRHIRESDG